MIEEQIKGAIGIGCETKPSGSRPSSAKQKSVGYKSSSRGTTPIPFSSGNPSVENAEGIVHIYKERYVCMKSVLYESERTHV